MPTVLEALMHGGAAYLRGETEARDLREQRRQRALLQALQMRDMQERLQLAQQGQAFEQATTREQMTALERHRQSTLGLQREQFTAGRADVAQVRQAQEGAARALTMRALPGHQQIGTMGATVAVAPSTPVQTAAPLMQMPREPGVRATVPRLLEPSVPVEPRAPVAQGQARYMLPVPKVTEEMLAEPLQAQAPVPQPQEALLPQVRPREEIPQEQALDWMLELHPEAQLQVTPQGVTMPLVPTPSEEAEVAHAERMREHEETVARYVEEHEIPESIDKIEFERIVRALYGLEEVELNFALLGMQQVAAEQGALLADLDIQLREATAPDEIARLKAQRQEAESQAEMARLTTQYFRETGHRPPSVSVTEYGPGRLEIERGGQALEQARQNLTARRQDIDLMAMDLDAAKLAADVGAAPADLGETMNAIGKALLAYRAASTSSNPATAANAMPRLMLDMTEIRLKEGLAPEDFGGIYREMLQLIGGGAPQAPAGGVGPFPLGQFGLPAAGGISPTLP